MAQSPVVISALLFDGILPYEPDEAFALTNMRSSPFPLTQWRVGDGERTITLPPLLLPPGREVWCAREALAFRQVTGTLPACEYGADTDPTVPNAQGTPFRMANRGDRLFLYAPDGRIMDVVVYKDAYVLPPLWQGPPLTLTSGFAQEGQILHRKWGTAFPLPDTNTQRDWAQDPTDLRRGRRVRYPGWAWEQFRSPLVVREEATVVLGVTPDTGDQLLIQWLSEAQKRIDLAVYTFTSPTIAQVLAQRAAAGVEVRLLIEAAPVGGLPSESLPLLRALVQRGATVGLINGPTSSPVRRYRYMHAKYAVVDDRWLIISTENFGPESFPPSTWGPHRQGRRGFFLRTNAPAVVTRAREIFAYDIRPTFGDIWWLTDKDQSTTLPTFTPPPNGYPWTFTTPITITGQMTFTLFTAPEATLHSTTGLLGLIDRAQTGDRVEVFGLYENLWWEEKGNDPAESTNPRWQALFAAASRGAHVRVLLDDFFGDPDVPSPNRDVAAAVNRLAAQQGWPLVVRTGNPTGLGIHAKVWLLALGEERWVVLTSLNGSAVSHKVNRELALGIASLELYTAVRAVFLEDWRTAYRP